MSLRTTLVRPHAGRRRGSTLIVVIALLASLMLLGFLFLTISSQEQENAYLFSNAAKVPQYAGSDYFDFALEQLILGARDDYYNSALWGGRASLLPTMFGNDLQPYNGAGVNLTWIDPDLQVGPLKGRAVVDQDFNGAGDFGMDNRLLLDVDGDFRSDPSDDWLALNLSPAAWFANGTTFPSWNIADEVATAAITNTSTGITTYGMANMPPADVEYTAPDLASPFLAYVAYEPTTGKRIVIPSFHRPQYLRGLAEQLGLAPTDWYTNADFARRTMRPHRAHVAVTESGANSGETRFIDGGADAGGGVGSYPFDTPIVPPPSPQPNTRNEGVWMGETDPAVEPRYDGNPDNDGVNEAVYIDLNYPEQVSADGTKTFVPLFAFTVYDADGLFNLNAHGNAYGDIAMYDAGGTAQFFGDADNDGTVAVGVVGTGTQNDYISRSNQGTGPHEINASVGLDEPPTAGATQLDQHERFFSHEPANDVELANMEWWFLLAGRPELDASQAVTSLYPGRWGEDNRLRQALRLMPYGDLPNPATVTNAMPYPGGSQIDDQTPSGAVNNSGGDAFAGAGSTGVVPNIYDATGRVFPPALVTLPHEQPLDVRGQGRYVLRTPGGKTRAFSTAGAPFRLPYYADYVDYGTAVTGEENWKNHLGGVLVGAAPWMGLYSTGGALRIDHPDETVLDPSSTSGGQDAIFSPGETATLQFSNSTTDQGAIAFSQRLLTLAPYNFGIDTTATTDPGDAQLRRKMYTTYSADVKTHGTPVRDPAVLGPRARAWEVTPDPSLGGVPAFPPSFAGTTAPQTQPFREEVRALLRDAPNQANGQTLLRKLSVNHVAEQITNPNDPAYKRGLPAAMQRVRLRPLTPHPISGLTSAPLSTLLPTPWPTSFGVTDGSLLSFEMTDAPNNDPPNGPFEGYLPWSIPYPHPASQEWHARRDRQNLARDIYVLLYTLGNADPAVNPVTTTNTITWTNGDGPVYTLTELREMAQFAVNLVDAMDEDDTITCFVYDLNLADGYTDLDDGYTNPISLAAVPPAAADANAGVDADGDGVLDNDIYDTTNNRGIVYGVETQKLALGEAMAVLAKMYDPGGTATDYKATDWDDTQHRDFTFVELQNLTPEEIQLDGGWSIVCEVGLTTPLAPRAVTLDCEEDAAVVVPPLAAYTVGTAGDAHNFERAQPADPRTAWSTTTPTQSRPSHFNIDMEGSESTDPATWAEFDEIAPVRQQPDVNVVQYLDFDLMEREGDPTDRNSFRVNDVNVNDLRYDGNAFGGVDDNETPSAAGTSPKAGGWLNLGPLSTRADLDASTSVTFHLRRRLNLQRTSPAKGYNDTHGFITYTETPGGAKVTPDPAIENDNPWIVVDSMTVQLSVFDLDGSTLVDQVAAVESRQRTEPLIRPTRQQTPNFADTPTTAYEDKNSLGVPAAGQKNAWQPHFDRPFASLGEVLSVPLFGPELLTGYPDPVTVGMLLPNIADVTGLRRDRVAAARVLFPDGDTFAPTSGFYNNLWYRAFEYISVPAADGGHQNYAGDPWFTVDAGIPVVNDQVRQRVDDTAGPFQRFGKLNLNTIRHPHVLAGLLDDFSVMWRPTGQTPTMATNWQMPTTAGETLDFDPSNASAVTPMARAWWRDFLYSRDGFDPYTGMVIPGLAVGRLEAGGSVMGRPFRNSSMALRMDSTGGTFMPGVSMEDTIFRRLPGTDITDAAVYTSDQERATARGLFELGGRKQVDDLTFDYTVRYRLLSKVLNNSTTRSNVFLVFIDVKYFNAKVKYTPGGEKYVRIGAPDTAANVNSPRAFFVVDRTKALETISAKDLPQANQYIRPGATAPIVTSSFARNADGTPTFNWRDLVLSSVRIQ